MHDKIEIADVLDIDGYRYPFVFTDCSGGDRPPVFFAGGALQTMHAWSGWLKHFDSSSTLLADLPGTINGDYLPADISFARIADGLVQVLDHLRIDKIDIVAMSYSTPVAVCFASTFPDRVGRMVLGGSCEAFSDDYAKLIGLAVDFLEDGREETFRMLAVALLSNTDPTLKIPNRETARKVLFRGLKAMDDDQRRKFVANSRRTLAVQDMLADMVRPSCPTLGFTGEYDRLTPPASLQRFVSTFPGGPHQFFVIPEADHLFFLEKSKLAMEVSSRWIEGSPIEVGSEDLPRLDLSI